MTIDILTLFPDMCESVLSASVIGRARMANQVDIKCWHFREYSSDKHKRVDDAPFGGGMGMVIGCQPVADCFDAVVAHRGVRPHFIYMSPKGKTLTQQRALELSRLPSVAILCGHYEGVDQRVLDTLIDEEISIGNYVLTGGELPAVVLCDTVVRLLPGVLSDDECFEEESHFAGLLEYPHYTRPADWNGLAVPEVLLSGHHANIIKWRREQSLLTTLNKRPELLETAEVSEKERKWLKEQPAAEAAEPGAVPLDKQSKD